MLGNPDILETVPNDIMAAPFGVGSFLEPVLIDDDSDMEATVADQTVRFSPGLTLEDSPVPSTSGADVGAPDTSEAVAPHPDLDNVERDLEVLVDGMPEPPAASPTKEAPATGDDAAADSPTKEAPATGNDAAADSPTKEAPSTGEDAAAESPTKEAPSTGEDAAAESPTKAAPSTPEDAALATKQHPKDDDAGGADSFDVSEFQARLGHGKAPAASRRVCRCKGIWQLYLLRWIVHVGCRVYCHSLSTRAFETSLPCGRAIHAVSSKPRAWQIRMVARRPTSHNLARLDAAQVLLHAAVDVAAAEAAARARPRTAPRAPRRPAPGDAAWAADAAESLARIQLQMGLRLLPQSPRVGRPQRRPRKRPSGLSPRKTQKQKQNRQPSPPKMLKPRGLGTVRMRGLSQGVPGQLVRIPSTNGWPLGMFSTRRSSRMWLPPAATRTCFQSLQGNIDLNQETKPSEETSLRTLSGIS